MNKNILVAPEEVCLFAVHRIQQGSVDGIEPGTSERCLFFPDALRSINDCIIGGTFQREYGQCHRVDRESQTRIGVNERIIFDGEKIHESVIVRTRQHGIDLPSEPRSPQ